MFQDANDDAVSPAIWRIVRFCVIMYFWSHFYRMKASQYVILNTKNKIGKVIRKKLSILQYSSANCWAETALIAFSCISHLNLSLHSILMFILRWPDTYRCFLNNIAAYLKYKKYLTLFILLLWIEIIIIIFLHKLLS